MADGVELDPGTGGALVATDDAGAAGHVQFVKSVALDCDGDALLVRVDQVGAACHTGTRTCFDGRELTVVAGNRD